jgi:hypothetical protein
LSDNTGQLDPLSKQSSLRFTRHEIQFVSGANLVRITLRGNVFANLFQRRMPAGVTIVGDSKKPVFVLAAGSTDPVAQSLAAALPYHGLPHGQKAIRAFR